MVPSNAMPPQEFDTEAVVAEEEEDDFGVERPPLNHFWSFDDKTTAKAAQVLIQPTTALETSLTRTTSTTTATTSIYLSRKLFIKEGIGMSFMLAFTSLV